MERYEVLLFRPAGTGEIVLFLGRTLDRQTAFEYASAYVVTYARLGDRVRVRVMEKQMPAYDIVRIVR